MIFTRFTTISHRNIQFKSAIPLLLLFSLLSAVTTTSAETQSNLRIEINEPSEFNDLDIKSFGALIFENGKQAHMDLLYSESLLIGDSMALDLGGGYVFGSNVAVFIGLGASIEYNFDTEEFYDKYYSEVGVVVNLTNQLGLTARQLHFFNQADDYEEVIMIGLLFRN